MLNAGLRAATSAGAFSMTLAEARLPYEVERLFLAMNAKRMPVFARAVGTSYSPGRALRIAWRIRKGQTTFDEWVCAYLRSKIDKRMLVELPPQEHCGH